jgi:hypothetical protein
MSSAIQQRDNLSQTKLLLSRTLRFLRLLNRLKQNLDNVDLAQLSECVKLLEDPMLCSVDSVRKEMAWIKGLFREKISKERKELEAALQEESEVLVRR